jgi:hypothetical protein
LKTRGRWSKTGGRISLATNALRNREARAPQVIGRRERCGGPIVAGEVFVGAGVDRHAACPSAKNHFP